MWSRFIASRLWKRVSRLAERPFAAALAFLLFAQMAVSTLHIGLTADALTELVPDWLLLMLSIAYGIGGLLMLIGLIWERGDFEAAGCVLVGNGLLVRMVAVLFVLGFTPATTAVTVFYFAFGWACWERFRQILNGERIIRVRARVKLVFHEEAE